MSNEEATTTPHATGTQQGERERLRTENARLRAALARARAEVDAFHPSEGLLYEFLEAIPHFVYAKDLDGRYIMANPAHLALFDVEIGDVLGKDDRQRFGAEAAALLTANDRAVIEAGAARQFEESQTVDGAEHYYLSTKFPLRQTDGSIYAVCGISTDITAQKQAERELRALNEVLEARVSERTQALAASRDQFARLFHASPVAGGITTLAEGRFLDINERFAAIVGYERQKIVGSTASELALWVDPRERERMVERLLRQRGLDNHELRFRTRSGEERTALASVELIEMDGRACVLGMYVDITDRIRAEEQIQALVQALTLAEQRERRRLSAVLHNDLLQLLFSLEMQLHLLRRDLEANRPSEQHSTLSGLAEIEEMMEQALIVTRTLSLELNPPVLRSEGLSAALSWLATHMKERHLLQVDLEMAEGIKVVSEERRILLVQFVRELLFNVVKHAGSERALVSVGRKNGTLVLTVTDDGRGFDMPTILDRQLQDEESQGLGLFSIRERLGLFGGKLQIESEPGGGTRVTIHMPLLSP